MSYVEKALLNGENVVYSAKVHWVVYLPGALFVFVGLCLFAVDLGRGVGSVFGTIVIFMGLLSLAQAFIQRLSTELAVTSKRVIAKVGLISRATVELNHNKVESFQVDQSILGRIFGFGTVEVNGTGGGKTPIHNIDDPLVFRREAMQTIDALQDR